MLHSYVSAAMASRSRCGAAFFAVVVPWEERMQTACILVKETEINVLYKLVLYSGPQHNDVKINLRKLIADADFCHPLIN